MGGRGRYAGTSNQITMDYLSIKNEIGEIIRASTELAKQVEGTSNTGNSKVVSTSQLYKKCACCFNYSIPIGEENVKCSICGWIDDEYQNSHEESINGENSICLKDYRAAYLNKS